MTGVTLPVPRTLCWGTHEEADRLGVGGQGTRQWAYRWIEEHVKSLATVSVLADIGGGDVSAALCNRLAPYARRVLVIDRGATGRRRGHIHEVVVDLERGLDAVESNSIDVFVTASSIEHLTASGQQRVYADVERALKPGGIFCGTVSYITRLTPDVLRLLRTDPVFEQTGSNVLARMDFRSCLAAAPRLHPPFDPVSWAQFPGYDGFDEAWLLANPALISNHVGSYGNVRCLPEVDALRLAWYELGFFLCKSA